MLGRLFYLICLVFVVKWVLGLIFSKKNEPLKKYNPRGGAKGAPIEAEYTKVDEDD